MLFPKSMAIEAMVSPPGFDVVASTHVGEAAITLLVVKVVDLK
jgi:hypothetical protein